MVDETTRKFVHLHLHSHYSLLDGANRIDRLIERVKELGMGAVALTDHGNLHGAVEFYNTAKAAGVKPILGIEAYVAIGDRRDRVRTGVADGGLHLVLLAENDEGWGNLIKLSSDAYLNGYYYRPRMDKTTLGEYSEGLIAINGHLGSPLAHYGQLYLRSGKDEDYQRLLDEAKWYSDTFGVNDDGEPCHYVELQRHEEDQEEVNGLMIRLARELGLPLVCDNDAHFLTRDDHEAHDALICISTGKLLSEPNRMRYLPELYVKSTDEMYERFEDYADGAGLEALENTVRIADRCNVEIDLSANHAPVVKIELKGEVANLEGGTAIERVRNFKSEYETGSTQWYKDFCSKFELHPFDAGNSKESAKELKEHSDWALRMLTEAGAIWRYGVDGVNEELRERMDRELTVLADKLISAYILICWDCMNEARSRGIPCMARGSAVGTMVGFCLGISNACTVKYGLLFERFTDPDRSEYPDIDIDICPAGRGEILSYVREKYGHVAQIITFGTLKARAVIRDVGRVMDIPLAEVDRIAKLVPSDLGMTLEKALEDEPELRGLYETDFQTQKLIDIGMRLEGLARHSSVHAAGVVVATEPLENIVPLYKAAGSSDVITQWDGPTCEKVGLLKMDFLGLRTLSIIQRACDLVEATISKEDQRRVIVGGLGVGVCPDTLHEYGVKGVSDNFEPLDLERLTYVDQNVLDLFRRGDTSGVFQFESGGMRNLLMAMKPDKLSDLIAANALFRPGPMALIDSYVDRKHGRAVAPKVHPIIDSLTEETHGIMVYQEQVMQIVYNLGGIPLRAAYTLIKAIGKKNHKVINANRVKFVESASGKGMSTEQAEEIFDLILKFAGYGFNKSHSTGYAIVAYQTAFLKTYFPVHYMAALLTYEMISTEKTVEYIEECRRVRFPDGRVGIDVHPPDINQSMTEFTVVYDEGEARDSNHGHIRFGLGAVKGVGSKAVASIIAARDKDGVFTSLFDFCERVSHGVVNKGVIEAIIKCGAFDKLHGVEQRSALLAGLESAISRGVQEASLRSSDDFLFGAVAADKNDEEATRDDPQLPGVPKWSNKETLANEKDVLGFYVSSHPMDEWREVLDRFTSVTIDEIGGLKADVEVIIGGMFTSIRPTVARKGRNAGDKMAMITLEDRTGIIDGVIFSDGYKQYGHLVEAERIVFLVGKVDRQREKPSIRIDRVIPVDEASENLTNKVKVVLRETMQNGSKRELNGELPMLRNMLRQSSGSTKVFIEVHESGQVVLLNSRMRVRATNQLQRQIEGILQDGRCCELIGPTKLAGMRSVSIGEGGAVVVGRVACETASDEFCESIDRY